MSTHSKDRRRLIVAQKVELYSLAYRTAWRRISPVQRLEQRDLPLRLHAFIRQEIRAGATDPSVIAVNALKALDTITTPESA